MLKVELITAQHPEITQGYDSSCRYTSYDHKAWLKVSPLNSKSRQCSHPIRSEQLQLALQSVLLYSKAKVYHKSLADVERGHPHNHWASHYNKSLWSHLVVFTEHMVTNIRTRKWDFENSVTGYAISLASHLIKAKISEKKEQNVPELREYRQGKNWRYQSKH